MRVFCGGPGGAYPFIPPTVTNPLPPLFTPFLISHSKDENGDCFHLQLGIETLARSRGARGGAAAYERFAGVVPEWQRSRLWGQRYDWVAQVPKGWDVLTDALMILYGGVFGSLGVRPTLAGIERVAVAAPQLEGASFTFAHLGSDVTLRVAGGAVVEERAPSFSAAQ